MIHWLPAVLLVGIANMNLSNAFASSAADASIGTRPRAIRFVDLVFEAQSVAIGRILEARPGSSGSGNGQVMFEVERSFGRTPPPEIIVEVPGSALLQGRLRRGATLILFLTDMTDRTARLYAGGDVSVWPRETADWRFSKAHVQPLGISAGVVQALFEVDAQQSYEARIGMLTRPPFFGNPLGEVAALQFANSPERWPEEVQGGSDLSTMQRIIGGRMMLAKRDLDFAAEIELIQLVAQMPSSVAWPFLISKLTHSDVAVRDTAITELEAWTEQDFEFQADGPEKGRMEAVDRWTEWFEGQQESRLRRDVPVLLAGLGSDAALERYASDLMLRVISERSTGFNAFAPEEERRTPMDAWRWWWVNRSQNVGDD